MLKFSANMHPLLIGSFPIDDHEVAVRLVLEATPEIPLWAQLPVFPGEGMMTQFLPGIPGETHEGDRVFIDASIPTFEEDLLAFYEDYLSVTEANVPLDDTRFSISPEAAPGFFLLLEKIKTQAKPPLALKGQITGPVTMATGVTDQNRRALFYDDRILDVVVKTLAMKARWQAEHLALFGVPAIVFIDEPALAGFGTSAFVSISAQDVQRVIGEVVDGIHEAGGLAGVHVCANTDWSLILESQVDILSFDAYGYFERLALYKDALKAFFDAGRLLAWGIVPTSSSEEIDKVDVESLSTTLQEQLDTVASFGVSRDTIHRQSFITPSCGTGALPWEYAKKVLDMTRRLSERFHKETKQ